MLVCAVVPRANESGYRPNALGSDLFLYSLPSLYSTKFNDPVGQHINVFDSVAMQ